MSLRIEHVSLSVHRRALLDDICLEIRPGRVHVLLGPNGAGKSMLLNAVAGNLAVKGQLMLDGHPLSSFAPHALARRRAFLPQQENTDVALNVSDMVRLGRLSYRNESITGQDDLIGAVLARVDAFALRDRAYRNLSGGQQARVRLARTLAQVHTQLTQPDPDAPCYLLMDEPTAHLDWPAQHQCLEIARTFARAGGGVLLSVHDPIQAAIYADDLSLIRGGRLVRTGPRETVFTPQALHALYQNTVQLESIFKQQAAVWSLLRTD